MAKNLFRINNKSHPDHGKLDRVYLRVCACNKLLKLGVFDRETAIQKLEERGISRITGETITSGWIRWHEYDKESA